MPQTELSYLYYGSREQRQLMLKGFSIILVDLVQIQNNFTEMFLMIASTKTAQMVLSVEKGAVRALD